MLGTQQQPITQNTHACKYMYVYMYVYLQLWYVLIIVIYLVTVHSLTTLHN